jgi:RNA polymerase sigma-70 factor (ECF subfamily)
MLKRILKDDDETKDALQEIMMKLWEKRHDLGGCRNLGCYIVSVARNYCFDVLKKKSPLIAGENEKVQMMNLQANETGLELKEKIETIKRILDDLPEKYRTVMQMRDIDGFEFDEIGEFTGLEVPHVRVILSRARQVVKNKIERIYSYEVIQQFT